MTRAKISLAVAALLFTTAATAFGAASAKSSPSAAPTASAPPSASPSAAPSSSPNGLPPGHPAISDDDEMPADHPPIDDADDDDSDDDNPHGQMQQQNPHGQDPRFFTPPADKAEDDPSLPAGTIVLRILDANDKPVAGADVSLGILHSSVARGDSRERKAGRANDKGELRFDGLDVGSGTTYRIVTTKNDAEFADTPFALGDKVGKRATLHVYDTTDDISQALVGAQATVYIALREDALVVDEFMSIYNVGRVAWVADASFALPAGFKAFNHPESMGDVRIDETKKGAALRGTITPGRHDVSFRYQVPLEEVEKQSLSIGMPPHVAQARVIAEASKTMGLAVGDFPAAQKSQNREGKRVLVTERTVGRAEGGMPSLAVTLTGLPVPGSGRWLAVALAAVAILVGVSYVRSSAGGAIDDDALDELVEAREALLGEIVQLERLKRDGEVGPRTYSRLRAALLDSLARIVDRIDDAKRQRHGDDRRARSAA